MLHRRRRASPRPNSSKFAPKPINLQNFATHSNVMFHSKVTYVFVDSRFALLCHALRICVAHVPTESCPFSLLVHSAYRACYRSHFHYCHKINVFKNPFQESRFERLDDAFVLLVSLIFLYPQKIHISVR